MSNFFHRLRRGIALLAELFPEFLKYELASLCATVLKCFCPSYRHLWLVAERGREARDNGYHFFAYLRREHPEINAWYIADPTLPDYARTAALGQTAPYRSWKHYLLCAASEVKISTHILGYTPDIERYYFLDKLHVVRGKRAFLQHGVTIDDMPWYHYPNVRTDLFVCALRQEAAFVADTFHYPPGVVQCLGFCRFDALHAPHPTRRQLLFMPTWRTYAVEGKTQAQFTQTDYYRQWQAVLESPILAQLLAAHDAEAVFYPHFEVQRFLSAFHTPCPRVHIAALGEADVQTLLMESAVLVADFSSVQFDFATLQKPIVYYQFDEAAYWGTHHHKGYFDYRTDGFGPVAATQTALWAAIEEALGQNGRPSPLYAARAARMFGPLDANNCARNYRAIRELIA